MTQVSNYLPRTNQTLSNYDEVKDCLQKWCWATQVHINDIAASGRPRDQRISGIQDRLWHSASLQEFNNDKVQRLILKLFDGKELLLEFQIKEATGKQTCREVKSIKGGNWDTFELCIDFIDINEEKFQLKIKIEARNEFLNAQEVELSAFSWNDKRDRLI